MPKPRARARTILLIVASLLAAAVVLLLVPASAFARAGGGGGYHSGGGGGGHSGGGGGGGDGGLIWLIIQLVFDYPAVGVPVVIVVVVFFIYAGNQGKTSLQSGVIRRGQQLMQSNDRENAIALLREHDPNFSEPAFCQRVGLAFRKIQAAWCMQDLNAVRPFISDGVYERFLLQFDEQRAEGYRDHMEDIRTDDIRISSIASAGLFDEVAIRISAAARDWRESLKDGKRLSGSTGVEPFVEIWSFIRRRSATTNLSKTGLIEGNCPNCGAPVEMNQSANCAHCKALLRSGEYDWVLTEITQGSEWDVASRENVPGVAELRQRDPGFDPVALEDRASVMFWRKATADRTGKIDPLRKIAGPQFATSYAGRLKPPPGTPREFVADSAVGSVATLAVLLDDDAERALVQVRWSGKRFVIDGQGRVRNTGEDLWASSLYVLVRKAGSQTDATKSIASAHCPNCGAPESGGASNACEFCGTVLNDGQHGWVLENVLSQSDAAAQELLARAKESRDGVAPSTSGNGNGVVDPMGLLAWMVKIATADGEVDPREQAMLSQLAARGGVDEAQVQSMISAGLGGNLSVPEPSDQDEARAWLAAMAEEAWADGKLTREEMDLLRSTGQAAGLGEYDINQVIRRARASVYAASSAALRQQRRS